MLDEQLPDPVDDRPHACGTAQIAMHDDPYSAPSSGTGAVRRSSSGSASPRKHGSRPTPTPPRTAAARNGKVEARKATLPSAARICCSTQRALI